MGHVHKSERTSRRSRPRSVAEIDQAWEYTQTNDKLIWGKESQIELLIEADELMKLDPEAGFNLHLQLAEAGSVWAMCVVGARYYKGRGVSHDLSSAEYWYRRSIQSGCTRAILDLHHLLYKKGDLAGAEAVMEPGLTDDWGPSLYWVAMYRLRRSRTRHTLRVVRPLLEQAAKQGSLSAKIILGGYMARGWLGFREVPRGLKLVLQATKEVLNAQSLH